MRKVIGWVLFGLGIPFLIIATAVSKAATGHLNFTIAILVTALIMGGGWILAHPKRK
ncbi:hypothetical protein ES705_45110 [subsurface metagenome]